MQRNYRDHLHRKKDQEIEKNSTGWCGVVSFDYSMSQVSIKKSYIETTVTISIKLFGKDLGTITYSGGTFVEGLVSCYGL